MGRDWLGRAVPRLRAPRKVGGKLRVDDRIVLNGEHDAGRNNLDGTGLHFREDGGWDDERHLLDTRVSQGEQVAIQERQPAYARVEEQVLPAQPGWRFGTAQHGTHPDVGMTAHYCRV